MSKIDYSFYHVKFSIRIIFFSYYFLIINNYFSFVETIKLLCLTGKVMQ